MVGDPMQQLWLQGQPSNIVKNTEHYHLVESEQNMVAWLDKTDNLIDKYDCRALLDEIALSDTGRDKDSTMTEKEQEIEVLINFERYRSIIHHSATKGSEVELIAKVDDVLAAKLTQMHHLTNRNHTEFSKEDDPAFSGVLDGADSDDPEDSSDLESEDGSSSDDEIVDTNGDTSNNSSSKQQGGSAENSEDENSTSTSEPKTKSSKATTNALTPIEVVAKEYGIVGYYKILNFDKIHQHNRRAIDLQRKRARKSRKKRDRRRREKLDTIPLPSPISSREQLIDLSSSDSSRRLWQIRMSVSYDRRRNGSKSSPKKKYITSLDALDISDDEKDKEDSQNKLRVPRRSTMKEFFPDLVPVCSKDEAMSWTAADFERRRAIQTGSTKKMISATSGDPEMETEGILYRPAKGNDSFTKTKSLHDHLC
eukprot:TRINITY_DN13060_c0_g1_i1.p1 TRINITY_DN13060_c0_g1~~TRINITY_DN13060_c0_g1_i1.p1  ORF type:complete len:470 (+),score=104.43 TRINITY_DN13060_c0_g1_i1:141-1412(+)